MMQIKRNFKVVSLLPSLILIFISANGQSWSLEKVRQLPIDSTLAWMSDHYTKDIENFHDIALVTLQLAKNKADKEKIGDAHSALRDWHDHHVLFGIDSALHHSQLALRAYENSGNQRKVAETLVNLGDDFQRKSQYDEAQDALFRSIAIHESLGDAEGVALGYKYLATIFEQQDDPEQAIKYANLAIDIFKEREDHYNHSITLWTLIHSYRKLEQFDQSIAAANECIRLVDTYIPEELAIKTRGYAYRGDTEAVMGQYDNALKSHQKAYDIVEGAIGPDRPATQSYRTSIGDDLRRLGKPAEALPHQLAGIQGQLDIGVTKIWKEYEAVALTYDELGQPIKANEYRMKALTEKNAMLEDKVKSLKSEALIKYETGKKDQAIAEQEKQIDQQRKIQWLVGGAATTLALLLGLLFYNFRRSQKTAKLLSIRNAENELLLKEIHHRVKNNLQTISSLLNIQAETIEDTAAFDAIQESKNRVASMALIHQKLYQGENLASIEMRNYLETMGSAILNGFGPKAEHIDLQIEMNEIEMDVDTAIPVGLITNELVTNSIKHAFPNQQNGAIKISLQKVNEHEFKLVIADNGAGKTGVSSDQNKGFGTLLVQLLTAQLQGEMDISTDQGTATILRFPEQIKSAV